MRRTARGHAASSRSAVPAGSPLDEDDAPPCPLALGSKNFSIHTGLEVYDVLSVIGYLAVSRRGTKQSNPIEVIREAYFSDSMYAAWSMSIKVSDRLARSPLKPNVNCSNFALAP